MTDADFFFANYPGLLTTVRITKLTKYREEFLHSFTKRRFFARLSDLQTNLTSESEIREGARPDGSTRPEKGRRVSQKRR